MDATLIEAWASFKSIKRKDGSAPPSGGDGTGMVDFRGEKRSNATHESSTDKDAKLMRKGNGQPAKLSYGAHALMENRNGMLIELAITDSRQAEPYAQDLLDRRRKGQQGMKRLGADKGYHTKAFVELLRKRRIAPHVARIEGRNTPGLDGRTSRHESYRLSQRNRKRIEEILGWMKTIGGLRKSRFIGFGIEREDIDGVAVCRMFNCATYAESKPNRPSTDHDPLFRFHRWLANLRVLEIEEVKSVPYAPMSHPFVERLIGTIRREYLDRMSFWNAVDLARKLGFRVHRSLDGSTSAQRAGASSPASAKLDSYSWSQHCRGLFQTPIPA